jgi:hypothetical protein
MSSKKFIKTYSFLHGNPVFSLARLATDFPQRLIYTDLNGYRPCPSNILKPDIVYITYVSTEQNPLRIKFYSEIGLKIGSVKYIRPTKNDVR